VVGEYNKRLKTDKNKSGFYRLIGCYTQEDA
jgi:hypothetical protein